MSKNKSSFRIILLFMLCSLFSCQKSTDWNKRDKNKMISASIEQVELLLGSAKNENKIPRSVEESGEYKFCREGFDWTEGFFPGILWNIYSIQPKDKYKDAAIYFQNKFENHKYYTANHDLGFVFNNSFGKAYKITKDPKYKEVLVDAGNSLIQRFNPNVGCIQSWDVDAGWQATRNWEYPVIIDNMMNLEMLFEITELTSDSTYFNIAVKHANTTLKNHFREDYSSYHVVDYDSVTGAVRKKETAQGYAHESAWTRGQAWGLYGYTVCYRYTNNTKYLKQAKKIAAFILNHPNLPADKVPYWDFDAPKIPNEPRDASAAAIIASALLELDKYTETNYKKPAFEIIQNLSSEAYFAEKGTNHNFILKHSVGSIPHNSEIDAPLIYADYYFIEAMLRLNN